MVNHTANTQIPQSLKAGVFNGRGIFDFGAKNEAYADYFTGTSYLALLNQPGLIVANVTFEPGCRNFGTFITRRTNLARDGRPWVVSRIWSASASAQRGRRRAYCAWH